MVSRRRNPAQGVSPALELAAYCVDGPLAGQGFTEDSWRRRLEAARNMGEGHALHYRPSDVAADLRGFPKAAEALAGYAVTWLRWQL